MEEKNEQKVKQNILVGIIGTLTGLLLGAGTALLWAPKSGRALRGDIKINAEKVRQQASELTETAYEKGSQLKEEAYLKGSDLRTKVMDKTSDITQKAQNKTEEVTKNIQDKLSTDEAATTKETETVNNETSND